MRDADRYRRLSEFYQVQNGAQIDIHYRAGREGEQPREMVAYSDVAVDSADDLVAALNTADKFGE